MTRRPKPRKARQRIANDSKGSAPVRETRVETSDDTRPTDDDALTALGLRETCAARRRRAAAE